MPTTTAEKLIFPDPDLVMLHITKEHIEEMKAQIQYEIPTNVRPDVGNAARAPTATDASSLSGA